MARKRKIAKITEELLSQIEQMSGLGLTNAKCARVLGIHPNTFDSYKKQDPRIEVALEAGKAKADLTVSQALFRRCTAGDMSAIRWYEMTRVGRAEKAEVETTEKPYVVVAEPPVTEDEWTKQHGL